MKLSEKLLKKIKSEFPEIITHENKDVSLIRVRCINDGVCYKWSNGQVGDLHLFSYCTMKECLVNEIFIDHHYSFEGNHGWEIYIK